MKFFHVIKKLFFYYKIYNVIFLYLHLESLIEFLFFMGRVTFCNISRVYFFFFNTQNIKSNCQIIFLKRFHVIYFWRIFYSIPIVFIYKKFNIWYFLLWISWILHGLMQQLLHTENIIFIFRIFCCYFIFYSVCRINIWPPPLV